ncbi:MAG: endopeptidase La [Deltaproteobacteria bacterium]|nr:endopeptidase La [Deltaproteobacteria bacterium]
MMAPLAIGRPASIQAVDGAAIGDRLIAGIPQKDADNDDPRPDDLYDVGIVLKIVKMMKPPNGGMNLLVQGQRRVKILRYASTEPFLVAQTEPIVTVPGADAVEIEGRAQALKNIFKRVAELNNLLPAEAAGLALAVEDPEALVYVVASALNLSLDENVELLREAVLVKLFDRLQFFAQRELQRLEISSKIQSEIQREVGDQQREHFLREQLKAIHRELGEKDERQSEVEELRKRIDEANLPEEPRTVVEKELKRLSQMPAGMAEGSVIRSYVEWILDLPWTKRTEDQLDVAHAREILDADHYDLEKVKQRILETLAVRKLKPDARGPILCFVGPPGTGKTSLGKSIARALGRQFVRISLGGVRDEAEIRGHRRTYVGALPGRIIQGLKRAGSHNPVFMLDEVDKLGNDFRGDPSSALLEVLDPEQNNSFSDHYLEIPFDLSEVMWITTANVLQNVPAPLQDRMEVLELAGYTSEEKAEIAHRYLVPRELAANGLMPDQLTITDEAIRKVLSDYTREAGLRNLERAIAGLCRYVARERAEGRTDARIVTAADVEKILGARRFFAEVAERAGIPGVATGLAWTPAGGDILFIESAQMPGSKGLTITGQVGDVMKESAQAALTVVRSRTAALGIADDFFTKVDLHVHVPAGAIPKDGPSAGVAMVTSIVSLLTGKPVNPQTAMTGEITLRGKVLPVGGIKEKVLAARRAGIRRVVMPRLNAADLNEVPPNAREGLEFVLVDRIEEALDAVFREPGGAAAPGPEADQAKDRSRGRTRQRSQPAAARGR